MLRSKAFLFTGIILLVIGITIKKMTSLEVIGLILIGTGILLKTIYIVSKARSGEYKPGKELIYLFLGLLLFMTGIVIRKSDSVSNYPIYLIFSGLLLKIVYVVTFVRMIKKGK